MKVNESLNQAAVIAGTGGVAAAARKLEESFVAEMLKIAFPKPSGGGFDGGIGEERFSSFLVDEQARIISSRLDLGLARAVEGRL